jgi:hypothetical protein
MRKLLKIVLMLLVSEDIRDRDRSLLRLVVSLTGIIMMVAARGIPLEHRRWKTTLPRARATGEMHSQTITIKMIENAVRTNCFISQTSKKFSLTFFSCFARKNIPTAAIAKRIHTILVHVRKIL